MSATSSRLSTDQTGRVLAVTFARPPRHFFDDRMSIELDELTRALMRDRTVGAVVFTGADDTFITHMDVPELLHGARSIPRPIGYTPARVAASFAALATRSRAVDRALCSTPARDGLFMARIYRSFDRLNRMDKVTIASINGLALGMGCIFALACDLRYAAEDTEIGMPEAALALLAGAGGTQRLTRMVGTSRALELLLTGRNLSADEAHHLGLIHHTVPRADLPWAAHTMAERLARRAPSINREIKRNVYDAATRPLPAALKREAASLVATLTTPEAARGLAAYNAHLDSLDDFSDEAIIQGWRPLLEGDLPRPPHRRRHQHRSPNDNRAAACHERTRTPGDGRRNPMLAMKDRCESCLTRLAPDGDAFVCSYECTYCSRCRADLERCPNCGGELVVRPRRTTGAPEIARRAPARLIRRLLPVESDGGELALLDVHEEMVAAEPDHVWDALLDVVEAGFTVPGAQTYARIVRCADRAVGGPRPLRTGSTLPGFRVTSAAPGDLLELRGRHALLRLPLRLPPRTRAGRYSGACGDPSVVPRPRRRLVQARRDR